MQLTDITPDQVVYFEWRFITLNATVVHTWVVMAILIVGSWLAARNLSTGKHVGRWQTFLEVVVGFLRGEIRQLSERGADTYLPFIGTLFIFIAISNVLDVVPGFTSPMASLSTTGALAISVLVAVPLFGVAQEGLAGYLKHYIEPSPFMLPFHVIGELSRTLALAVRLFGNVMSGTKIVGVLIVVAAFTPLASVMQAFSMLVGVIQGYIFALLAMVYISSGTRAHEAGEVKAEDKAEKTEKEER